MKIQFKPEWVVPTIVGVAAFGAGIAAGYAAGYSVAAKRKDKFLKEVVMEDHETWSNQLKLDFDGAAEEIVDPGLVIMEGEYVVQEPGLVLVVEEEDTEEEGGSSEDPSKRPYPDLSRFNIERLPEPENMVNIFTNDNEDWDYEVELAKRDKSTPYIIHRDEYYEKGSDKPDYEQSTLEYYIGDSILTDDQDVPLYNPKLIVGELIFGHGSNDPSICYVRNETFKAEYEVLLNHGFFQEEVLGAEVEDKLNAPDLKHSLYKFRD